MGLGMIGRCAVLGLVLLTGTVGRSHAQEVSAERPARAWSGVTTGQAIPYASSERGDLCVEVGPPRVFGGATWVALRGFAWPGLATDSQIFLPTDGPFRVGVIRTPGPTPRMDALVPTLPDSVPALPHGGETIDTGHAGGWFAIDVAGSSLRIHLGCEGCGPDLTIIMFDPGAGLLSVEVAGREPADRIQRLPGTCEPPRIRLDLEVSPAS